MIIRCMVANATFILDLFAFELCLNLLITITVFCNYSPELARGTRIENFSPAADAAVLCLKVKRQLFSVLLVLCRRDRRGSVL